MSIDISWLENRVFLHKLLEHEAEIIKGAFNVRHYRAGDEIIRQGEKGGLLHILRSGYVAVTHQVDNRSVFLGDAEESAVFGEISFLSGGPAIATVTAHHNCIVYELSRSDYCTLMVKSQELVLNLFTHILSHTSEVISRMNQRSGSGLWGGKALAHKVNG